MVSKIFRVTRLLNRVTGEESADVWLEVSACNTTKLVHVVGFTTVNYISVCSVKNLAVKFTKTLSLTLACSENIILCL